MRLIYRVNVAWNRCMWSANQCHDVVSIAAVRCVILAALMSVTRYVIAHMGNVTPVH